MAQPKMEETYYDVLKVDPKATIAEIVAAYHTAKNAFSKDSVATYTLFTPEEAQAELDKLEQAYLHLSNIDKKRAYDRVLEERLQSGEQELSPGLTERDRTDRKPAATPFSSAPFASAPSPLTASSAPASSPGAPTRAPVDPAPTPAYDGPISGTILREIRERRQLSLDDVARITKIPMKFIAAIESEDTKGLPARVYLQGFIKNLATLYKLDPKVSAKSYLDQVDSRTQEGHLPKG